MEEVISWMAKKNVQDSHRRSDQRFNFMFNQTMADCGIWLSWVKTIKREPNEKESRIMEKLVRLIPPLRKSFRDLNFRDLPLLE